MYGLMFTKTSIPLVLRFRRTFYAYIAVKLVIATVLVYYGAQLLSCPIWTFCKRTKLTPWISQSNKCYNIFGRNWRRNGCSWWRTWWTTSERWRNWRTISSTDSLLPRYDTCIYQNKLIFHIYWDKSMKYIRLAWRHYKTTREMSSTEAFTHLSFWSPIPTPYSQSKPVLHDLF